MKVLVVLPVLFCISQSAPKLRIMPMHQTPPQLLTLPSNATSIRTDIYDSFSCDGRDYGYYADVENDCQLFHVCLPITYMDGRNQTFRWSFICPEETVFNQEIFTCTRSDEAIDCAESPKFYDLNLRFGDIEDKDKDPASSMEDATQQPAVPVVPAEVPQNLLYRRARKLTNSNKQ